MPKFALMIVTAVLLGGCNKEKSAPPLDGEHELRISVNATGYEPSEARAPANKPVRLVFTRTSDEGCGQKLVLPSINLQRDLPLNQPVAVDVTMPASGRLAFTCGMNMYKGAIVAQ